VQCASRVLAKLREHRRPWHLRAILVPWALVGQAQHARNLACSTTYSQLRSRGAAEVTGMGKMTHASLELTRPWRMKGTDEVEASFVLEHTLIASANQPVAQTTEREGTTKYPVGEVRGRNLTAAAGGLYI
jgi:hypothetical protein